MRRMAAPSVVRTGTACLGLLHLLLGLVWWLSAPERTYGPVLSLVARNGGWAWPSHPMWPWAFAFTLAAGMIFAGLRAAPGLTAAGLSFGAVALAYYGAATGLSAAANNGSFGLLAISIPVVVLHVVFLRGLDGPAE